MQKHRHLIIYVLLYSFICNTNYAKSQPIEASKSLSESQTSATVQNNSAVIPQITFENTVYDFGQISTDSQNTCEFKFTNTGQALLKIGEIKPTCGCTVFSLDKKEYAPGETGTIKITYTAGKLSGTSEKHIFVPTNDKNYPNVKLTIKANAVRQIEIISV